MDMANSSGSVAAGTCTLLPGRPTTGSATCLPSKSGTSTGVSHHPMLSASAPEGSSNPPTSLPILPAITHTPSGHPVAHPGTADLYAVPKSSSGKSSQSPFAFPQFVATLSYPIHSPVPVSVNTAAWPSVPNSHVSKSHNSSPRDGLPSNEPYEPFIMPSPTATTHRTATSISSGIPGGSQSIFSTVTSMVTETPRSTYPIPVSIAETTDGQPTVSVPPSVTSTIGLTTLANGAVVSNPVQSASSSSASHSFFGNHLLVISVFLASGIAITSAVVLTLYCCLRRQGKTRRHKRRLQEISSPFPQTIRGDVKPYGGSSNQIATTQHFFSVPLNRSGDSLPVAHSKSDTHLPRPATPHGTSKSSYRVPVRYSVLDAPRGNLRTADWQYAGPFSDYHPVQVLQPLPPPNVPPPLPERSPLRMLATKNSPTSTPQQDPNRLSQASSLSLYPPSSSSLEAAVVSENIPGMVNGRKKSGKYTQAPGLSRVVSDGTSSSWRAQHSLVGGPTSGTRPAQTSILDEVRRLAQVQRAAGVGYKVGR